MESPMGVDEERSDEVPERSEGNLFTAAERTPVAAFGV